MKKEEIRLDDWQRILFGEAPPVFLLETLVRAIIIYVFLLMIVRLLGKRMSGQLTLTEMAVLITLGSIISPSLETPERGILLGVFAMMCTLSYQRGTTWLAFRNKNIEYATQGEPTMLIKNGILELGNLADTRVSRQQIFAKLRGANIYNVSEVKRLYLEAAGDFSLYKADDKRPGLSTLPTGEAASISPIQAYADDTVACTNCANTTPANQAQQPCTVCKQQAWTKAVN